ncbi:hypothetical protein GALMADRAFT_647931 [Galerina marginata CBS 339.88]|uniref:Secreted protein n=1 Tax=Galerina marginata (strain CBS 339.88) TaxID=685588 RepID=A0A067TK48_GALM3|nr:hypothetical protein GALMADRAFT_647931 [Galerina marginata CBS 339.88]
MPQFPPLQFFCLHFALASATSFRRVLPCFYIPYPSAPPASCLRFVFFFSVTRRCSCRGRTFVDQLQVPFRRCISSTISCLFFLRTCYIFF